MLNLNLIAKRSTCLEYPKKKQMLFLSHNNHWFIRIFLDKVYKSGKSGGEMETRSVELKRRDQFSIRQKDNLCSVGQPRKLKDRGSVWLKIQTHTKLSCEFLLSVSYYIFSFF